ncbi:hypothetical protein BJX66DRAFT_303875 [Aspergillus keveii]|uniref:Uncharacterized protein n=1 Tax=Aspergillus keveii TaxID=714993 RepID=A0ABR4G5Z1_9EURO
MSSSRLRTIREIVAELREKPSDPSTIDEGTWRFHVLDILESRGDIPPLISRLYRSEILIYLLNAGFDSWAYWRARRDQLLGTDNTLDLASEDELPFPLPRRVYINSNGEFKAFTPNLSPLTIAQTKLPAQPTFIDPQAFLEKISVKQIKRQRFSLSKKTSPQPQTVRPTASILKSVAEASEQLTNPNKSDDVSSLGVMATKKEQERKERMAAALQNLKQNSPPPRSKAATPETGLKTEKDGKGKVDKGKGDKRKGDQGKGDKKKDDKKDDKGDDKGEDDKDQKGKKISKDVEKKADPSDEDAERQSRAQLAMINFFQFPYEGLACFVPPQNGSSFTLPGGAPVMPVWEPLPQPYPAIGRLSSANGLIIGNDTAAYALGQTEVYLNTKATKPYMELRTVESTTIGAGDSAIAFYDHAATEKQRVSMLSDTLKNHQAYLSDYHNSFADRMVGFRTDFREWELRIAPELYREHPSWFQNGYDPKLHKKWVDDQNSLDKKNKWALGPWCTRTWEWEESPVLDIRFQHGTGRDRMHCMIAYDAAKEKLEGSITGLSEKLAAIIENENRSKAPRGGQTKEEVHH